MIPVTIPRWSLSATLVSLVLLLICMGYMVYQDYQEEYRGHQKRFRQLISDKFGSEKASRVELGFKQLWIPEIGVADRCITCHLSIGWEGLQEAEPPLGTHSSPELIKKHPVDKFGCTPCHGGQGLAINGDEAHDWNRYQVLWGPDMYFTGNYLLKGKTGFLESRCNFCHRYENEVKGMDLLNHGKRLIEDKGCRNCHIINGYGGKIGPDLTYEGDRDPILFNFAYGSISPKLVFNWHMAHFYYPKNVMPTSIMPRFRLTAMDRKALTLLVMSWKKNNYPVNYLPHIKITSANLSPFANEH